MLGKLRWTTAGIAGAGVARLGRRVSLVLSPPCWASARRSFTRATAGFRVVHQLWIVVQMWAHVTLLPQNDGRSF